MTQIYNTICSNVLMKMSRTIQFMQFTIYVIFYFTEVVKVKWLNEVHKYGNQLLNLPCKLNAVMLFMSTKLSIIISINSNITMIFIANAIL